MHEAIRQMPARSVPVHRPGSIVSTRRRSECKVADSVNSGRPSKDCLRTTQSDHVLVQLLLFSHRRDGTVFQHCLPQLQKHLQHPQTRRDCAGRPHLAHHTCAEIGR
jgi:hypothetical protein